MTADGNRDQVLFVGVGAMGAPMVRLLAWAGYRLVLYDTDTGSAESLAEEAGAAVVPALTGADLAAAGLDRSDGAVGRETTVVLMLPDTPAVEAVLRGTGDRPGLLGVLPPGSLLIDMGSSRPASTVALADEAADHDVALVDAPVSGGVARAVTGELSIMFGGPQDALDRCHALLAEVGSEIVRTGPVGAGHAMKALNNLSSAIGMVAASEVLSIGARFGLDPAVMLQVLNNSSGRNQATEVKFPRYVLPRAFDSGFALRLMVKDLHSALDLAKATETTTLLGERCLQTWSDALDRLGDEADHTEIARYVEQLAGVELRGS